jgi:hypothetical protein
MATSPGFSSRSITSGYTQFPQRDEAQMSELEPGFSNSKAVEDDDAETKVVDSGKAEDKAVKKTASKRKS